MENIPAFIAQSFTDAEAAGAAFYAATIGAVAAALQRVFALFLSIYLLLWGLAHWRGLITEPTGDFATRIIKLALIGAFSLNTAIYVPHFADRLYRIPNELVAIVQPALPAPDGIAMPASGAGALDTTLELVSRASNRFMIYANSLGWTSFAPMLLGMMSAFLIELIGLVLVGLGAALLLVSKIALAILLAVGPIFVLLLLFDATRALFQAWLGQVITAMLTYVLAGIVIYFALFVVIRYLNTALVQTPAGTVPALGQFVPFLLLCVVAIVLLLQVPAMAAAIGGGVQVSTLGVAQAASRLTFRGAQGLGDFSARPNLLSSAVRRSVPLRVARTQVIERR